ncbi:hydroxyethylthiazole kinase [Micropruina sonneratiae]|uniref:hydroxyethylthiazole kinase n=1 Tax=Micropruina sonneratiae TaxID=2986940 RepID=UPI002226980B|nr:hydroxyethylthiazole kinase [Micropruina sp. KQZ13P-5]MCW3159368.1 hydroxyethylthiazole kinase [Micropruina sp. KQZ13P-5]
MASTTSGALTSGAVAESSAALLTQLRQASPLVQCLTNHVASGFTANVLLALGAAPAMVDVPGEAGGFATVASGVLVNLGTLSGEQPTAMREAVSAAATARTPWVLDPVAVGSLPVRTALAAELVAQRPAVVRGNASEIVAVAGSGGGGRGVDAAIGVDAAAPAAQALAGITGGVVAVSGPVDLITDGRRVVRVGNGHELLTRVTGAGCALGAAMAAFAGLGQHPLLAATAASVAYGVAAEAAAARGTGPGSFAVALLDALDALDGDAIRAGARIDVTNGEVTR